MAYDVSKLLKMSRAEIDKFFAESPPGPISKRRGGADGHRRSGDGGVSGNREDD